MLHSPFGGLSFVTNIFIAIIGGVYNFVKGNKTHRAIISQKHILELEKTKTGSYVAMFFSYFMPVIIFVLAASFSAESLVYLYRDKNKVTVIDIAEGGIDMGKKGYVTLTKVLEKNNYMSSSFQVAEASVDSTIALQILDTQEEIDAAFNSIIESWGTRAFEASTTFLLFPKAADETKLIPFLQANGIPTTFEVRERLASFFGIEAYNGTEKQNNLLRKKLGEMRLDQLGASIFVNN